MPGTNEWRMCGTLLKSSAQRAFSLKWELVNCHRTGVSIRGLLLRGHVGRGFTYNLVSSGLQDCQLECALDTLVAVQTFSSSSCSHVRVPTRGCADGLVRVSVPRSTVRSVLQSLSSSAAKGFFALTSRLERDLLLFFR